MMKLTVTFLAALTAADAAEARSHRQARRQYGNGYGEVLAHSSKPVVQSSVAPLPYNPTTAEVFAASVPAALTYPSSGTPTPAGDYGSGFSEKPYDGGESSKVPHPAENSSVAYPGHESSDKPVKDATTYPSATGTYPPTGYPAYPTGTGSYPKSSTPLSDYVIKTIYSSVVITQNKPKPTPEATPYKDNYPTSEDEYGTTTIKSTTTKYVTIKATPSNKTPSKEQTYPTGPAGPSRGKGEECAAPVTVTVTAKETITVTKEFNKPSGTPSSGKPTSLKDEYPPVKPSKSTPAGEEYTEYPASSGKPTKPSATPSAKNPIGNSTYPSYSAGPTGFQTSAKPAYPTGSYGSDVPTKPSETSSPSYFSFVSEVPYPSETPAKILSEEQTYPSPTPSPADSGYGSGYGTY
ncbi:hypothetical protein AG0111_0g12063 [Alternaria gaisen]|uniref:Uncharacterized protein n=1 Tax=Alternaria gaisen TaxID=167740 RepID=A0ACB6F5K8_9PLEO|nr:hypothetical protein AG0111_0g12063 [Alternaria gaisen]